MIGKGSGKWLNFVSAFTAWSRKTLVTSSQWLTAKIHTTQQEDFVNVVKKHRWEEPITNSAQSVSKGGVLAPRIVEI